MSLDVPVWTIIRRMIVTLQTERLRTVEQIEVFLGGNAEVDFKPEGREAAYRFARRTLVRLRYASLDRRGKGAVREYLGKTTGFSRAQVTRLIAQYRETGRPSRRQQRSALRAGLHAGRHPPAGRGRRDRRPALRAGGVRGAAAGVRSVRGPALRAPVAAVRVAPVQPAPDEDLPRQADHGEPHQADDGRHRREAAPGSGRQARLRPGGHGAPGRPGPREGRLRHQSHRRGHPVRACRRGGRDLRGFPAPGAGRDARDAAVRRPRLPRGQRLRVHQPPGRGAAQQAARPRLHEVPRPPIQRSGSATTTSRSASRPRSTPSRRACSRRT